MRRVVIADDSIASLRQLEKIIAGSGEFEVVGTARNGLEAIRMYQAQHPDILCMDLNMPEMDGISALRTLVALDQQAKVVLVTSLGGVGDKFTEALKLGAKAIVAKPFQPDHLLRILREL